MKADEKQLEAELMGANGSLTYLGLFNEANMEYQSRCYQVWKKNVT
jgi:hypothetical protein